MTYFVCAIDEESGGVIGREIEAVSFSDAMDVLDGLMMENFGAQRGRMTSITEEPIRGPIHLAIHLSGRTAA